MPLDSSVRPPVSPVIPGAYSAVDASALQAQPGPGLPIICVLGATTGGKPNVMQLFRDQQALKSVLRSGAAFDCARFAFAAGAVPIGVVRVGAGILPGTKALAGATGSPVTITALDSGAWTNSIQVTVAANNVVTITFTDSNGAVFQELFNLGVSATAQNVVDAINGKMAGYNPSQYVSAAVTAGTMPLSAASIVGLTGGSDGTLAAGDWTTGLQAIETEDVDIVCLATGDSTIHAQAQTHCDNMSASIARRERTGVYGAILGETDAQQVTRIASLRDKRSQLVHPGVQDYDAKGVLTTWDPFYLAAKIAGMHAAQPDPATPIIHQNVPCVDVERQLSTVQGGSVETLIRAGVTPVVRNPSGGFWVSDSLSGWNTDDTFRDFHKTRAADAVAIRLRVGLESAWLGKKVLDSTQNDLTNNAQALLQGMKDSTLIRAFNTPQVQQGSDARTWLVTAPVLLPDALKFIFITVALQPSSAINREVPASADALL